MGLAPAFAGKYPFTTVDEVLARAYAGGPRSPQIVAGCTERFLAKHDDELAQVSTAHRDQVRAQHYENVASNAFEARQYRLGSRLDSLKSFRSLSTAESRAPRRTDAGTG